MKNLPLKITFLGTGTSQGVPVIGCGCAVCSSKDPKDQRLRTSVLITKGEVNIAVDAGPDFRQQMLRAGVQDLQAILLTHEHNDHVIGLDDVRAFNFRQWKKMPVYATLPVQAELKKRFSYIFDKNPYPGAPMVELRTLSKDEIFEVGNITFIPIEVMHGTLPVLGFRIGDFTYLTDVKTIEPTELEKVKGSRILVLNALHHTEHHSHLNLKEALELIQQLQPEQAYLIHVSHKMGLHESVSKSLPPNVQLAYDGLEIFI